MSEKIEIMEKMEIIITVDSNDADYLTQVSVIEKEDLEKIMPLIEAIKNFKPYEGKDYISTACREPETCKGFQYHHNYPNGEYCPRTDMGEFAKEEIYPDISELQFEIFEEFCEYGEYGFHSVKSVEISPLVVRQKLL